MSRRVKPLAQRALTVTHSAAEVARIESLVNASIAAGMPTEPPKPVVNNDMSGRKVQEAYAAWAILYSKYQTARADAEHGTNVDTAILRRFADARSAQAEALAIAAADRAAKESAANKAAQAEAAAATPTA